MSHSSSYPSSRRARSAAAVPPNSRRHDPNYSTASANLHSLSSRQHHVSSERPSSSGSSTLADAMGALSSRSSHSPPGSDQDHNLNLITQQDGLLWLTNTQPQQPTLIQSNPYPQNNHDPYFVSNTPHLPNYPSDEYAQASSVNHHDITTPTTLTRYPNYQQQQYLPQRSDSADMFSSLTAHSSSYPLKSIGTSSDDVVRNLQRRIYELESINESQRLRLLELESHAAMAARSLNYGLPSPPPSATFQDSWERRTVARTRYLCSLNRAGNALCAWHDSRRERRAYPPRHAPPGHLNCGCKYEEALFEESIARHNIGSYHPGESVRMDPALRNPLLKLLQATYNYKDGDFERNPLTGTWKEGEGHEHWERKLQSVYTTGRRSRDD